MASTRASRRAKTLSAVFWVFAILAGIGVLSYRATLVRLAQAGGLLQGATETPQSAQLVTPADLEEIKAIRAQVLAGQFQASPTAPAAAPASSASPVVVAPAAPAAVVAAPPPEAALPAEPAAEAPPAGPAAEAGAPGGVDPANGTAAGGGNYTAKYGFYIHAYGNPPAVIHQVRQLKKFFPGSPIYIMSDGGHRFDALCSLEGCMFTICPPANDRWHPWPFMRRMYDAAVALKTEYLILLEPDVTIHGPITRHPTHDAGGLHVKDRQFGLREYVEQLAQEVKPGYKWRTESMAAGLCGGSYYRTAAILDAFSDESVARLDWNYIAERGSKEIFSSDFAMQYLLAARGYDAEPWQDAAQMEKSAEIPHSGPADAAFKHYGGGFPGGKPTYNLRLNPKDVRLVKDPLPEHRKHYLNCQVCWSLEKYMKKFGSAKCANHIPFKYSDLLIERYKHEWSYMPR